MFLHKIWTTAALIYQKNTKAGHACVAFVLPEKLVVVGVGGGEPVNYSED
jgi:hypothetical protein